LKSFEVQLPAVIENKLRLTYKGKLELILNDADRLGKLNDRFIDAEVAKKLDYPIFMAVSEDGGKDNSGEYIFVIDENGNLVEDHQGNAVIKQDLVNYNLTSEQIADINAVPEADLGIAELFIKYAKENKLKFWE
jgi:type I restriction enzyme M protein